MKRLVVIFIAISLLGVTGCSKQKEVKGDTEKVIKSQEGTRVDNLVSQEELGVGEVKEEKEEEEDWVDAELDESMMGVKADSYEEDTYDYPTTTYRVTAGDKEHVVTTPIRPIQTDLMMKDILDFPDNYIGDWITLKGKVSSIVEEQGNYATLKVNCSGSQVLLEYARPTGAPRAQIDDYIIFGGIFKGLVNDWLSGIIPNIETELAFKGAAALPVLEVTPILNDWSTGKIFVPNVEGDILKCYENDIEVWSYSYGLDSIKENRDNAPQNVGMIDRFNTIDLYQDENNNLVVTGSGTLKPQGEAFNMQFVFTKEGELIEAIEVTE